MSKELLEVFSELKDPRIDRTKKYPLIEIIFLVVCGSISGCDGWKSIKDFGEIKLEWLRKFLPYKEGIPVDDTIARVMRRLDTKEFQSCFIRWMQEITSVTNGDVVAIDGKTLRRSYDASASKAAIHMVSAWSCANKVVLGQVKTAEKSNEITAIPELLEILEIKGCIVTIDAMGCQEKIAQAIIKKKADYIFSLKANHSKLHADVESFFKTSNENNFHNIKYDFHEECNTGHGRIEKRQCWVISSSLYCNHFHNLAKWKKLNSIVMIKSERTVKGKTTEEFRFYISSCLPTASLLLGSIRKHWEIENSLHWTLDMTFREDESRIRKDSSPENYAIVRHIALNIIKSNTTVKASVKRKLKMASLSDQFRETLIRGVI